MIMMLMLMLMMYMCRACQRPLLVKKLRIQSRWRPLMRICAKSGRMVTCSRASLGRIVFSSPPKAYKAPRWRATGRGW